MPPLAYPQSRNQYAPVFGRDSMRQVWAEVKGRGGKRGWGSGGVMEEWIIGSLNCWMDDPLAGPLFAEAIKAGPGGDAVGDHELIADQIGRPDELSPKAGCVERGSCFQDKPMGVRRPGKDKIAAAPGDAQCWRARRRNAGPGRADAKFVRDDCVGLIRVVQAALQQDEARDLGRAVPDARPRRDSQGWSRGIVCAEGRQVGVDPERGAIIRQAAAVKLITADDENRLVGAENGG